LGERSDAPEPHHSLPRPPPARRLRSADAARPKGDSGGSPSGPESRGPRVGASPRRNASEPTGGLETKYDLEAELFPSARRQHGMTWAARCVLSLWRGGRNSTMTRACRATGETVIVPSRNRWSRAGSIAGNNEKSGNPHAPFDVTGTESSGHRVSSRPYQIPSHGT